MSSIQRIVNWVVGIFATLATVAFFVVLLGIGFVGRNAGAETLPSEQPAAVPASVARVERRPVELWTRFSGRLEAVERVDIRSRVAGAVEAAHFREGSLVEKGAPLLTIDPAPYQAAVSRAESELEAAKARLAYARGELQRGTQLQGNRTIAVSEYERRVQASLEAQAQLAAAEAMLRSARLDLAYTDIRAPVSGRIGRLEVTAGNLVSAGAGSPVLARMVSVDPIYASFDADEGTVDGLLAATQGLDRVPVEMDLANGTMVRGHIQLIDPSVDPENGTVGIRVAFSNKGGALLPGQFARIRLGEANAAPAILVAERAVGTDQDRRYVLVVGPDDTVEYRNVTLGRASGDMRVVESGLAEDERIVVNGLQRLRPGARVEPRMVSMETGQPLSTRTAQAEPATEHQQP
ncbi:efflux RND transporter periplasmic adaptor subunit [Aureimonas altamirensis]|uniref:efflux RND transporter periplasmic adaptor subunit n=1 Tax=Aureimonas altamirensis TaxID=370622 RepID=UPI003017CD89